MRVVHHARKRNRSGTVLIVVLALTGVMAGLVFHLQYSAHLTRQTDQRLWHAARLRAALLDEAFARLAELTEADATMPLPTMAPYALRETERPDGIVTLSQVRDLNRYIDLNNLVLDASFPGPNETERILIDAMTQTGDFTPIERIEALRDWMDADDTGIRESNYYLARTPPYRTPNTWMHTWDELRWIEGFSPDYLEPKPMYTVGRPFSANLTDLVSVVPGPRARPVPINLNTASPEVLYAVFGPAYEALARYIVLARDDQPFRSIDALLAQVDPSLFQALSPFISVESTHFLIEAQAFETGRRAGLRVLAVRAPEGRVRILQWVM